MDNFFSLGAELRSVVKTSRGTLIIMNKLFIILKFIYIHKIKIFKQKIIQIYIIQIYFKFDKNALYHSNIIIDQYFVNKQC